MRYWNINVNFLLSFLVLRWRRQYHPRPSHNTMAIFRWQNQLHAQWWWWWELSCQGNLFCIPYFYLMQFPCVTWCSLEYLLWICLTCNHTDAQMHTSLWTIPLNMYFLTLSTTLSLVLPNTHFPILISYYLSLCMMYAVMCIEGKWYNQNFNEKPWLCTGFPPNVKKKKWTNYGQLIGLAKREPRRLGKFRFSETL